MVAVLAVVVQVGGQHHTALHYFDDAARLLIGDGGPPGESGLHLYSDHTELQFGPPAIVVMVPFTILGPGPMSAALTVVMVIVGLAVLHGLVAVAVAARSAAGGVVPITGGIVVGGVVFVVTWSDLAMRTAHIDDVLAIATLVGALSCCQRGRPWVGAVLLGVGAAAKPWAVGFIPLAAATPSPGRAGRPLLAVAVALAWWAPFVLAEPSTVEVGSHAIEVKPESVLALFWHGMTPGWCRPLQLVGGLLLGGWLVLRGRWAAAPLAVVAFRLLLDPDVNRYYTVGFVLAALLFEWVHRPGRIPVLAIVGAVVLETSEALWSPTAAGLVRLALLVAGLVVVCRAPPSPSIGADRSRSGLATPGRTSPSR